MLKGPSRFARRVGMTVAVGALSVGLIPGVGTAGAAQKKITGHVASSWTQFRYDSAATGYNPIDTNLNTTPSSPSFVGNLKLAWKFTTNGSIYGGNATVANGIVYVGSQGGGFYALNETGSATHKGILKWSFMTGGLIDGAPVFDAKNGSVYFSSFDSKVYAFDAVTGALKWTFTSAGPVEGGMNLAGGVLYAASLSPTQRTAGTVYALNPATGTPIWSSLAGGPIEGSPAVDVTNGVLYIGAEDKKLHAFSTVAKAGPPPIVAGQELWTYNVGSAVDSSPALATGANSSPGCGPCVYFGADNGNEYAVNTTTHNLVWSFHTGRFVESSAGISGNTLVIGSADNNIYGLDLSNGPTTPNTPLWTAASGMQIESSPAVANGYACIGSRDAHMRCVDISNGNVLLTTNDQKKSSNGSPSIADGMVFMGSNDHSFYAYSLCPLGPC